MASSCCTSAIVRVQSKNHKVMPQKTTDDRWDCLFVGYCRIRKLYIPSDIITLIVSYHAENKGTLYLTRDLTGGDMKNEEIAQYLLQFAKSKWDFNNDMVNIYRLKSNKLNHKSMLPSNPIEIRFPQYLSTTTIPTEKYFILEIYSPRDKKKFPTMMKFTRIRIVTQETTCKQLIDQAVEKLSRRIDEAKYDGNPNDIIQKSSEFVLKVIGAEEYILYDDTKLVIDYEATRQVLNSKDISFQMIHCPNFMTIEQECNEKNVNHIAQFDDKYFTASLLTKEIWQKHDDEKSLLYCSDEHAYCESVDQLSVIKESERMDYEQQQQLTSPQARSMTTETDEKSKGSHPTDSTTQTLLIQDVQGLIYHALYIL